MRHQYRSALIAAAFAFALMTISPAFAAPATWKSIDVALHSEQGGNILLVSGELAPDTKLPAEAELSVPAGSQIQWIGEILGGAPSADPALKYTKKTVGGADVYRFTLAKSRVAQAEVPTTAGQTSNGANLDTALSWTAAQAVPEVRISARIPQGAKIVTPAQGASLEPASSGYSYYTKTVKNVKAGEKIELTFGYAPPPAVSPAAATPASASSVAIPLLLGLIGIVCGIAGFIAIRNKLARKAARAEENSSTVTRAAQKSSRAHRKSTVSGAVSTATGDADEGPTDSPGTTPGRKRNLATAAVIATIVVVTLVLATQATKPRLTGDTISQTFSQGEPCTSAAIALAVPTNADPTKTAESLFTALKPVQGLTAGSYNWKTSKLEVGFCESKSSEAAIRQALAPTGLVAQGASAQTPAPATEAPTQ